jgi:hypothetical protein
VSLLEQRNRWLKRITPVVVWLIRSGAILAILSTLWTGIKAYGEFQSLRARVDRLETTIDNLDIKLSQLPLCRRR